MKRHTGVAARYYGGRTKGAAKGTKPKDATDRMNKTEQRFADHLELQRIAGVITWWAFEPMTWRIAENTSYKPDFMTQDADGHLHVYEIKPASRGTFARTDVAWLKLKVVKEQFPFPLDVAWQTKDGIWHFEALHR